MALLGYHHAQISIPPAAEVAARRFYGVVVGLRELPVPPHLTGRAALWFAVGDHSLHVTVEESIDRQRTRAHLAYEIATLPEFEACRQRLVCDGREIIEQPAIAGWRRFHSVDPFGNRLEIICRSDPDWG